MREVGSVESVAVGVSGRGKVHGTTLSAGRVSVVHGTRGEGRRGAGCDGVLVMVAFVVGGERSRRRMLLLWSSLVTGVVESRQARRAWR